MLAADGRLEQAQGAYRIAGDLSELRVPESLQALVAARLDTLEPADRSLLQDAAVLGQTFATAALAAVNGAAAEALEPRLRDLARREVLALDTDPRSPERGQYGFTQALIREVAYSTLARRERRARHLAAARYFEGIGDDALAGALATHYLAAFEASPPGPEADAVAIQARLALKAAAERAAGLGSHVQAVDYLRQALTVTTDPVEQAELLERTGVSGAAAGRHEEAAAILADVVQRLRGLGDRSGTARALATLAGVQLMAYRSQEAVQFLPAAIAEFADMPDDPNVVALNGQCARAFFFAEDFARAQGIAEQVLAAAERLDIIPIIADTLVTRGMGLALTGRVYEGLGALEAGLRLAESSGLPGTVLRARLNIGGVLWWRDPVAAIVASTPGIELARRLGRRSEGIIILANWALARLRTGEWDGALSELRELEATPLEESDRAIVLQHLIHFLAFRGDLPGELLDELVATTVSNRDVQNLADVKRARASVALAAGRLREAFDESINAAEASAVNGTAPLGFAGRAAAWACDPDLLSDALARHEATGLHGPAVELERTTMRGALAGLEGRRSEAVDVFSDVLRGWKQIGCEFDFAMTAIDALVTVGPVPELADQTRDARDVFVRLGAKPLLERLDAAAAEVRPGTDSAAPPMGAAPEGRPGAEVAR
jgi:tetratricopeptide (TPR) repeat protein